MATAKKSGKATGVAKAAKKSAKKAPKKAPKKVSKKVAAKKVSKNVAVKKAAAVKSAEKVPEKVAAKKVSKKVPEKVAAKKVSKKVPEKVAAKKVSKKVPEKVAAKKAPKRAKAPFGQKFVQDMKEKLLAERAKYLHSAEEYRAEAEALIDGREPGDVQFDEEGGEGDTLAVERERDLALSNQARQAVDQIDAALDRIAEGSYGLCVVSGLPIPQERLRAIPWAAERVEYKAGGLGRL